MKNFLATIFILLAFSAFSQSINNEYLNAKDFGAVGNGSFDNAAALQSWLNAGTGKTLILPAGVYKTTANLTVPSGVILKAQKGATISRTDAGSGNYTALQIINSANIQIENLEITLSKTPSPSSSGNGITIYNSTDVVLDRLYIHDTGGDAISCGNTFAGLKTENLIIRNCLLEKNDNGITILGKHKSVQLVNNILRGGSSEGIHLSALYGYPAETVENVLIDGNEISGYSNSMGVSLNYVTKYRVANNEIYNCLIGITGYDGAFPGVVGKYSFSGIISSNEVHDCFIGFTNIGDSTKVTNNRISNIQYSFSDDGVQAATYQVEISGNTITNNKGYISALLRNLRNSSFHNNRIEPSNGDTRAIVFMGCQNFAIENNILPSGKIHSPDADFTGVSIRQNHLAYIELSPTYCTNGASFTGNNSANCNFGIVYSGNTYTNTYPFPQSNAIDVNIYYPADVMQIASNATISTIYPSALNRAVTLKSYPGMSLAIVNSGNIALKNRTAANLNDTDLIHLQFWPDGKWHEVK
jgi:nitrous oxidase accessory protein NosD